jgi:glycine cleavage system H protein
MAEVSYPDDLLYHPEHDWARIDPADPDVATLGITWFAQDALGEVVFFEPPAPGTLVTKDEPYAEVESVKAVSDVVAPLSGEIVEVNEALADSPDSINDDPYGEGWLVRVRPSATPCSTPRPTAPPSAAEGTLGRSG